MPFYQVNKRLRYIIAVCTRPVFLVIGVILTNKISKTLESGRFHFHKNITHGFIWSDKTANEQLICHGAMG
jgi:hypothetical protein